MEKEKVENLEIIDVGQPLEEETPVSYPKHYHLITKVALAFLVISLIVAAVALI